MNAPVVIDFETQAIEQRPLYPPTPVGVSVMEPGKKPRYYAWGHPTKNNCTKDDVVAVLGQVWKGDRELLFHNAKFDLDVAETHLGLKLPVWQRCHDTLFALFLLHPHALSLSLKPSAERLLGMPPEEQDAVRDWLVANKVITKSQKPGPFIAKAPGDVVGAYAIGDTVRTLKLYKLLYPELKKRGMLPAYDRERKLLPILLENERQGICINRELLATDFDRYTVALEKADLWIRERLGVPDLNIDADKQLAKALKAAGVVTHLVKTEKGQDSVSKANLKVHMFTDPRVAHALGYRNRLATCLGTFMDPWLKMSKKAGRIYTNWNQVRGEAGGARTGRLSSSPNFQNIPKVWHDKGDDYEHPKHLDTPELPYMRKYLEPDSGCVFAHRDYNQQELRILAHFEDGKLCAAYNENPRLDVHDFVRAQLKAVANLEAERREVKVLNFGMLYGMGMARLAVAIKKTVVQAKALKMAQRRALPGLAELEHDIKRRGKNGDPIVTWGGREYYAETPKTVKGKYRTFEYKLLNYLIQGSAADMTKEAIIAYHEKKKHGRFLVTVHDEINISVPAKHLREELQILKEAMESVKVDVPMLSDAKIGGTWGDLKAFEELDRKAG